MNAKYRALHEASTRINRSLGGGGIIDSPYTSDDAEKVYQMMVDLVPVGTRVRATYIPNPDKPTEIVTQEGYIDGHERISFDEPDFRFYVVQADKRILCLLRGSVLEAI